MTNGWTLPQPGCAAKSNGGVNCIRPGRAAARRPAPSPLGAVTLAACERRRAAARPVAMPAALAGPSAIVASASA